MKRPQILNRIFEFFSTSANALTARVSSYHSRLNRWNAPKFSWDRPDYPFWRAAYYCRVKGLELSGLFIKPLVSKVAAWTFGRPPHWELDSETGQEALADWWDDHHADILAIWRDSLKQGDMFLAFNPDLTVTAVNPDLVEPMVADDDFSNVIGWRVTQIYTHPTRKYEKQTVIDEYTLDGRTRIWEKDGVEFRRESWPNLVGLMPIVHIHNNKESGEAFGHPEAEALVTAFHRYGATLDAALDGNQRQGLATPVLNFETIEGYNQFWADFGSTETQQLPDGTTQTVPTLSVDLDQLLTLVQAEFSYQSPGSFAADTIALLEILFLLVLEHTELPEFVFGNAIASSKASAETQLPVFIRFIEVKRAAMAGWLQEIADLALAYLSLITPGVSTAESPALQWEQLEQDDGRLTLEVVTWAYSEGLLDRRTALQLAPLDVEDIDAVLAKAEKEKKERQEEFNQQNDIVSNFFKREIPASEEGN